MISEFRKTERAARSIPRPLGRGGRAPFDFYKLPYLICFCPSANVLEGPNLPYTLLKINAMAPCTFSSLEAEILCYLAQPFEPDLLWVCLQLIEPISSIHIVFLSWYGLTSSMHP